MKIIPMLLVFLSFFPVFAGTFFEADSGTVALWRFDEGSGDTAYDLSGNGNHARLYNTVWTSGLYNGAVELNGENADAIVKRSASLKSFTNKLTIEAVIRPYSFQAGSDRHIFTSHGAFNLTFRNGSPASYVGGMGGWWWPEAYATPLNEWLYIADQVNVDVQQLFINNELWDERPVSGTIDYEDMYDLRIGGEIQYTVEGFLFHGKIDEIRISDIPRLSYEPKPVLIPVQSPTLEREPLLQWHPWKGDDGYDIQVDTTSRFSAPLITLTTTDTFFQPLAPLPVRPIYWRVRSASGRLYSSTGFFIIQPDSVPFLYGFHGDTTSVRKPEFRWKPVSRAEDYRIEIDTSSLFGAPLITLDVGDTAFSPRANLAGRKYYWRVSCDLNPLLFSAPDSLVIIPPSGVKAAGRIIPEAVSASPNPFRPSTTLFFRDNGKKVSVLFYDSRGKMVDRFENVQGNTLSWKPAGQAAGVYVVKILTDKEILKKRLVLLK